MTEGPGQGGFEPPGSTYGGQPTAGGQPPTGPQPPFGPPPGYPGGPGTGAAGGSAKGFLPSLFDFSFSSFVATKVVKVLYVLIVLIAGLYTLFLLALGFRAGTGVGLLFLLVVCPLFFIVFVAVYRVLLEVMVVIFRMAEDLAEIRRRGGSGS
jgi:hypothetical protein